MKNKSGFKMKAGKEGPMKKNFPSAFKKDKNKTTLGEKVKAAGKTFAQTIGSNSGGGVIDHISTTYKTNKAIERSKRAKKVAPTKKAGGLKHFTTSERHH